MTSLTRGTLIAVVLVLILVVVARNNQQWFFRPTSTIVPEDRPSTSSGSIDNGQLNAPEVIANNLTIPWEIVFLPDNTMLVTERPGRLLLINEERTVIPVEGVAHRGEGGLLGMALHPEFSKNQFLYLYLTSQSGGGLTNRVERYTLEGTTLKNRRVILEGIPGASNHDGGRLAFGPDGMLYITTGDAGKSNLAQDKQSLAGKILRVMDDGRIPLDNPFGNAVYSYGHRNVQGVAWDSQGRLWATEHGRSGIQSGLDELNLIVKGANYGWPIIQGDQKKEGMVTPVVNSGPDETWAPSGMVIVNDKFFFAGLRGESLYAVTIEKDASVSGLKVYYRSTFGRLRSVKQGPDGMLYVLTSNRDGRGTSTAEDDRIIRVDPDTIE